MRLLFIAITTLSLGGSATLAQTGSGGSSPSGADILPSLRLLLGPTSGTAGIVRTTTTPGPTTILPQRQPSSRPKSRQKAYDRAVADCMQMWDSGTHMTKQEWSRSCKRVQTRLDNLNVEAIMHETKTQVR